jgi:hypothetical protein
MNPTHRFSIKQEPTKGKLCGALEYPSRSYLYPILNNRYPGLVLQLDTPTIESRYLNLTSMYLESVEYIVHVTLLDEDGCGADTIESRERRQRIGSDGTLKSMDTFMNCLVGQRTRRGTVLNDPFTNNPTLYFIFSDLAVRVPGRFILECVVLCPPL